jgi:anti-anti-sigma regulatory factor
VGCILAALGTFRNQGGDIILCNLSKRIMHILRVLNLCDYLSIAQDVNAASEAIMPEKV